MSELEQICHVLELDFYSYLKTPCLYDLKNFLRRFFLLEEEFDLDLRAEFDLDLLTEFDLEPDREEDRDLSKVFTWSK